MIKTLLRINNLPEAKNLMEKCDSLNLKQFKVGEPENIWENIEREKKGKKNIMC